MYAAASSGSVLVALPRMSAAAAPVNVLVDCPHMSAAAASGSAAAACPRRTAVDGVPTGVVVCDASQLLPWSDFARLLLHSRVQHLSDYVRALALARLGGGWIIDGDAIWLKRALNLSVA